MSRELGECHASSSYSVDTLLTVSDITPDRYDLPCRDHGIAKTRNRYGCLNDVCLKAAHHTQSALLIQTSAASTVAMIENVSVMQIA